MNKDEGPRVEYRILHSKTIGNALISLVRKGRYISCGRFLINGLDFIIDFNVWADSYHNNNGNVILKCHEPEFCNKLFINTLAQEQKYATYNDTRILYTDQTWEEYRKDLDERRY